MRAREYQRILREQLADYEQLGWAPELHPPTGAVIIDPVSGGTRLTVLVSREIERDIKPANEPRQLTMLDQHLVEDVLTALRTPGDHHYLLRARLLAALAEAARLRGDHASAERHNQARAELERAHTRQG